MSAEAAAVVARKRRRETPLRMGSPSGSKLGCRVVVRIPKGKLTPDRHGFVGCVERSRYGGQRSRQQFQSAAESLCFRKKRLAGPCPCGFDKVVGTLRFAHPTTSAAYPA